MPVREVITAGKVPVMVYTQDLEARARTQLEQMAQLPFIHQHIAAMADVHWGLGATIGSVIPTTGAIIPAAVGVDLGCGMRATRLDLAASDLPDNLAGLRRAIEEAVPHGRTDRGGPNDRGAWGEMPRAVQQQWAKLKGDDAYRILRDRHVKLVHRRTNTGRHLGTLGTGNHFIEVCLDEKDRVWVVLHSGSRGIGNRIGTYFIDLAKKDMKAHFIDLPDLDLAYLAEGTGLFTDYVGAVKWAQSFALHNRHLMMAATLGAMQRQLGREVLGIEESIDCHHNFIARENHFGKDVWVTRKGAVRARKGDRCIIPGSMGTATYIARGKGDRTSFSSCAHGAGRAMGRREARRKFTVVDLAAQTAGIECRKDADVLDEIPGAYKNIETVMNNQRDLIEIEHVLRQVVNVKG
ncbi:MAG: RtcB family protein [Acidobacteria bacterium]|nr:MAG: RtcB family protein [Acidobacteriota bacterium]